MSRALNHIKNVVRFISPFHSNAVITHKSLVRDYKLQKDKLSQGTQGQFSELLAPLAEKPLHAIPEQDGFLIAQMQNMDLLGKAITYCRTAWPKDYIQKTVSKPSKNNTLLPVHIDVRDPRNQVIKDLVLSEEILAPIANYFGEIPILYGAYVWYCPNQPAENMVGSQLFHCDREDYKQMKVFIPIDEITANCGPTTCVSAQATQKLFAHRKKQGLTLSLKNRFSDEEVHTHASAKEHAIIGKAGTLGFVDTTNCLHYGSRPAGDGKYHMVLHYLTPFSSKLKSQLTPEKLSGNLEEIVLSYKDTSQYLKEPVT